MDPLVLVIPVGAVVATAACIRGHWLGPALFSLGFLAVGLLMWLGGGSAMLAAFGIGFLAMGVAELVAASECWVARPPAGGADAFTRWSAAVIGMLGSAAFLILIALLARAIVGFYTLL